MQSIFRFTLLLLLAGGSLSGRSLGETFASATASASSAQPEATTGSDDKQYAAGMKYMDQQRWNDAVNAFDGVVAAKSKRADAAMYWKAYSLNKMNRKEEAGAVCGALRGEHPESTWNRECRVLQVRTSFDGPQFGVLQTDDSLNAQMLALDAQTASLTMSVGPGVSGYGYSYKSHATTDDDIKVLALNSIMQQDPAKGLPLLRDFIRSGKPVEARRQALFALSRSRQPEAQALLKEVALNKSDLPLQKEAVQMLAMSHSKDTGQTLAEVYRGSSDAGVKRAALNALYLSHDASRLVELARSEKDLNQKRDIVSQLALMKDPAATDYMMELLK